MLDHRNTDPGLTNYHRPLIVFAQAAVPTEPRKGPLNDPPLRHYNEPLGARWPFDDLQEPQPPAVQPRHQPVAHVNTVSVNGLQTWKPPPDTIEDQLGTVIVLHTRRGHNDRQQQAQCVHQQMSFASRDLL